MTLDEWDYRKLFENAPIGLAVLDRELRYVSCNAALASMNGMAVAEHIGKAIAEIVPNVANAVHGRLQTVFDTGEAITNLRLTADVTPNAVSPQSWLANARPIWDDDGHRVTAILVSVQELSVLEETQRASSKSQQMVEAWQQLNPDSFAILRAVRGEQGEVLDFEWEYANRAAKRRSGASELLGQRLMAVDQPSEQLRSAFERYVQALKDQSTSEFELAHGGPGLQGWFRTSVVAIDADRIVVSFTDIAARKLREEELGVALDEYRHRVKNLLAVVSGLVGQARRTARNTDELAGTIERQLKALASAQDLIADETSESIALEKVITSGLDGLSIRGIHVAHGPHVAIPPELVLPFVLVLHEMATNAVKYGALSKDGGRIDISWKCSGARVCLTWKESGGPRVAKPTRRGFGSKLVRLLEQRLKDGKVTIEFETTGMLARIEFETTAQVAEA